MTIKRTINSEKKMRVVSKIVESDMPLCDITLSDTHDDKAIVIENKRHFTNKKNISFHLHSIYSAGLCILKTQIKAYHKISNTFFATGDHVLFFFYFRGNSKVQGDGNKSVYKHSAGMLQRNYLNGKGTENLISIPRDGEIDYILIKMSRKFYIHLLKDASWINEDPFHQYILQGRTEDRPNETYYMNMKILTVIADIFDSSHIQQHRYHYLNLKLKELIFAIHQHTQIDSSNPAQGTESDMEVLEQIRAHLLLNLDNPPNIEQLSRVFMLNEKKLRKDFKVAYGSTVYAFVIQERMKKAKKLLYENHNVNELSLLLGYQSVSHFIKVFKKYHGCTPKEALAQIQAMTSRDR